MRRAPRAAAALVVLGASALPLAARQPSGAGIESLFPWRAPVTVERPADGASGALARLFLTPEVVTAARPDLADVRLVDGDGDEIPFAVDRDAATRRRVAAVDVAPASIRSANQGRNVRDQTIVEWTETYEITAPPESWRRSDAAETRLFLRVIADSPRFVKSLDAAAPDGRALLDGASLFRLSDPLRESVRFELPVGAGAIRIELAGEDGGWLEPTFAWERETALSDRQPPRTVELPLDEVARRREGDSTVLVLERPRGLAPLALVASTTTPVFRRRVTVFDSGPGVARRELADGEIRRLGTGDPELALPWPADAAALGGRLEVRVSDGDSPPLADLAFTVRLARPALIFAAEAGAARLLWGGARVRAPRYDVSALVPPLPASGEQAIVGRAALDESSLVDATLGAPEPNPRFAPISPLDFAMGPGRPLERGLFSHQRELAVPASPLGLYRFTLGAADLAVLREDLGDLRLVDEENRQRPYLLVPDSGRQRLEAELRESHPDDETVLSVELPSSPTTVTALTLTIEDAFFARAYTVEGEPAEGTEPVVLARGALRRERPADGEAEPDPLEIALPPSRVRTLTVRIVDGSDRPLEVTGVTVETPAPEVLFPAPPGRYLALLGDPDLEPPRYDLEAASALVRALDAEPLEPGPLRANDEFSLSLRLRRGSGLERTILIIALVTAVLALTVLTLRLTGPRGGGPAGSSGVRDSPVEPRGRPPEDEHRRDRSEADAGAGRETETTE